MLEFVFTFKGDYNYQNIAYFKRRIEYNFLSKCETVESPKR